MFRRSPPRSAGCRGTTSRSRRRAAELTLVDPDAASAFGLDRLAGRSINTPYLGRSLPGRVVATFHGGYPTVLDGELLDAEEVRHG